MAMNNLPFISIIVPVYNGEMIIGSCIKSLLDLEYPKDKYEIIIVDNNSKDKTSKIIKRYPVKYLFEDETQSAYAARNQGIHHSKGQIIAFTDADCVADKDWLINLIKGWETDTFGFAGKIEDPLSKTLLEKHRAGMHNQKHKLLESRYPCALTGNVAYKREIFELIGFFRGDLVSGGDADLTQRVQQAGYRIRYNPDARVIHKEKYTLKKIYNQAKRYAFGMIVSPDICQNLVKEREHLARNFLKSIVGIILMILYRIITVIFKEDKIYYLAMPFICIVESYGILQGKRLGLRYIKYKGGVKCPFE